MHLLEQHLVSAKLAETEAKAAEETADETATLKNFDVGAMYVGFPENRCPLVRP